MESLKYLGSNGRSLIGVSLLVLLLAAATPAGAAETVKIYRSTMPDGSVELSDKPSSGARSVASHNYLLTAPRGAAEAERDYWRRQSDAFNLRQQQREGQAVRRQSPHAVSVAPTQEDAWYPVGYLSQESERPLVPRHHVPRVYSTSPGAVRGRSSGFIGSGFSTSR